MIQTPPTGTRRPRVARATGAAGGAWQWVPVVTFGIAVAVLLDVRDTTSLDAPWLLAALNLVFLAAVPLLAAVLAVRVYLRTGVAAVLALGAAMLATGIGSGALAAVLQFPAGIAATIATHNVSSLLAGFLNFAAAIEGAMGIVVGTRNRRRHVVIAYGAVLLVLAAWLAALGAGLTPAFWGTTGTTAVRLVVLGGAVTFYALASLAWWQTAVRERRIVFLHWYVPGLALFAVALVAIMAQNQVGGAVNWLGRMAQYVAAVYLLIAVAAETRLGRRLGRAPDVALGMSLLHAALPLRPLVESTSDAVVGVTRSGRVVYWNRAAQRLFGADPAEAFDRDPVAMLAPEGDSVAAAVLAGLLEDPIAAVAGGRRELTLGARGGRTFPAEVAAFADPQDPRLVVLVISDVSERTQSRDELERRVRERTAELEALNVELARANAAKDEFLGLVSHELKTPITSILAAGDILHQRVIPENRAILEDLIAEAERLTGIVDNLLALARLDAGREAPLEPVALDRLAALAIRATQREQPTREIRLTGETGVIVEANPDQLGMVLRNYLSNALKYSPAGPEVEVTVRRDGDAGLVEVLDRGIGLAPKEIATLFEPFVRGAATRATAGIGIGLAVCRRIVEAHGGSVGAANRHDGGGARFWFRLPLAVLDAWDGPEAAGDDRPSQGAVRAGAVRVGEGRAGAVRAGEGTGPEGADLEGADLEGADLSPAGPGRRSGVES